LITQMLDGINLRGNGQLERLMDWWNPEAPVVSISTPIDMKPREYAYNGEKTNYVIPLPKHYHPCPTAAQVQSLHHLFQKKTENNNIALSTAEIPSLLQCSEVQGGWIHDNQFMFPGKKMIHSPARGEGGTKLKGYSCVLAISNADVIGFTNPIVTQAIRMWCSILMQYHKDLVDYIGNRPEAEWKWDKDGYTQNTPPEEKFNHCLTARNNGEKGLDGDLIDCQAADIPGWREPWKLTGDSLFNYINAKAPMPHIRAEAPAEDSSQYIDAKRKSEGGYQKWRNMIMTHPEGLLEHPIGDVWKSPEGLELRNLYPNYGIWEEHHPSQGKKFINFIVNPYKSVVGKTLLQELANMSDFVQEEMRKQFTKTVDTVLTTTEKVTDEVTQDLNKLATPALIYGAAAIALMVTYGTFVK
jgi:hypothetical protein